MAKIQIWDYSIGHNDISGWWKDFQCNGVGGWSVKFSFKNLTQKTIKYATFYFYPVNSVGDVVSCRTTGKSENGVMCTGPIDPEGFQQNLVFENAWYNNSILLAHISKIELEYMDGTRETITDRDIDFSKPKFETAKFLKSFFPLFLKVFIPFIVIFYLVLYLIENS